MLPLLPPRRQTRCHDTGHWQCSDGSAGLGSIPPDSAYHFQTRESDEIDTHIRSTMFHTHGTVAKRPLKWPAAGNSFSWVEDSRRSTIASLVWIERLSIGQAIQVRQSVCVHQGLQNLHLKLSIRLIHPIYPEDNKIKKRLCEGGQTIIHRPDPVRCFCVPVSKWLIFELFW